MPGRMDQERSVLTSWAAGAAAKRKPELRTANEREKCVQSSSAKAQRNKLRCASSTPAADRGGLCWLSHAVKWTFSVPRSRLLKDIHHEHQRLAIECFENRPEWWGVLVKYKPEEPLAFDDSMESHVW